MLSASKTIITMAVVMITAIVIIWWRQASLADQAPYYSQEEVGFEIDTAAQNSLMSRLEPRWIFDNWQRPPGPLRVGLQVGHWRNDEVPAELEGLKDNGGATGGGLSEWEVALTIALLTADILRSQGIEVDIIPATVPPAYYADAFVSIHADGSTDPTVSGFKVASPRRDYSGRAQILEQLMYDKYARLTGLKPDDNITNRMRGYYAFNWRRYEHALHPMTPAIILETGFLTSPQDRRLIVQQPFIAAQGIAAALMEFLIEEQ